MSTYTVKPYKGNWVLEDASGNRLVRMFLYRREAQTYLLNQN